MQNDLIRRFNNFTSKVYLTLGCQLFLTFGIVLYNNINNISFSNGISILSIFGMLTSYYLSNIAVFTNQSSIAKIFLIVVFSACESILITNWTKNFGSEVIISILLTTGIIFGTLSWYAFNSPYNYNVYRGATSSIINGMLFWSFMSMIYYTHFISIMLSILTIVLLSFYVIIDTQYIMLTDSYYYANNAYTLVSLKLYTDFVIMFVKLIKIFGKVKLNKN